MVAHLVWNIAFALICIVALLRGGRPEKITAVVLILADLISAAPLRGAHWKHVEPTLVFIDLCVEIFFIYLALTSSRWWPLCAAAFNALAVIMLLISALDPSIRPYAYFVGEQIWDYLVLMALLFGALIEGPRASAAAPLQASSSASAR
jgi:hypothetical protein